MSSDIDFAQAARTLGDVLGLASPPIAITFSAEAPEGIDAFSDPMPEPTPDGRTGSMPAGCVFWIKAEERTFTTVAADHGNCSVGSLTHGFKTLEQAAEGADVAALVESQWVSPQVFPEIPTVSEPPRYVTYGPLAQTPIEPDVVFLRLNAKQAMMLHDAWPNLRFEGKPQCQIIPIAKEHGDVAVSVGCILSRVRTGLSSNEMACAVPTGLLPSLVDGLQKATAADRAVAAYAANDTGRFS